MEEDKVTVSGSNIETNEEPNDSQYVEDNVDFSEDDYDTGSGLLTKAHYDAPESADKFVDTKDGQVVDKKDLTPMQIIKTIAEQNGTKIKDPNPSCKHCFGRGFDGKDSKTQMPIPCSCLFRGKTEEQKNAEAMYDSKNLNQKMNHDQRRRMSKAIAAQFNIQRKSIVNSLKNEKPVVKEELSEDDNNKRINSILKKYIKIKSLKKTAAEMNITLTELKKVIKTNKEKLEKMTKD